MIVAAGGSTETATRLTVFLADELTVEPATVVALTEVVPMEGP